MAGCYDSQYYNRLRELSDLVPLLGFPRLEPKLVGASCPSGHVITCLTCIPVGASFAVAIAQRMTNTILRAAGLPPPTPFSGLLDARLPGSPTSLPYIDDIKVVRTSPRAVNSVRDKAAIAFLEIGSPTEPSKNVDAGKYSMAIGLAWWRDGTLTVKPSHANKLFVTANPIVSCIRASPRHIHHFVVLWNWALLLRLPAFSMLFYC